MGKIRQLDTDFWIDEYVQGDEHTGERGLDLAERYLYIFLLTNPHSEISGVYKLPVKTMIDLTGLTRSALDTILGRFERNNKILYRDGWVAIKNRHKFNKKDNPSIQQGVARQLKNVPAFALAFINKAEKEKEGGETGGRLGGDCDSLVKVHTNTNTHTDRDMDKDKDKIAASRNFKDLKAFFVKQYWAVTQARGSKGKWLTFSDFEEKDLRKKYDELPDKTELPRAWALYTETLAVEWNEAPTLKTFLKDYTLIQQRTA